MLLTRISGARPIHVFCSPLPPPPPLFVCLHQQLLHGSSSPPPLLLFLPPTTHAHHPPPPPHNKQQNRRPFSASSCVVFSLAAVLPQSPCCPPPARLPEKRQAVGVAKIHPRHLASPVVLHRFVACWCGRRCLPLLVFCLTGVVMTRRTAHMPDLRMCVTWIVS